MPPERLNYTAGMAKNRKDLTCFVTSCYNSRSYDLFSLRPAELPTPALRHLDKALGGTVEHLEAPPDVVIRRLPLYARSLRYLMEEGVHSVSSQELGERINVTAAQIRKDLSYFGEFGKQGIGYDVEKLLHHIENILGLTKEWPVVLIGVGHLGQAIARYEGFHSKGLRMVALFDNDSTKIGQEVAGLTIMDYAQIRDVVRDQQVRLAIISVPAAYAQGVADLLIEAGVRAILNYAPVILQVPEDVWVRYIDPVAVLHSMTYYLARDPNEA